MRLPKLLLIAALFAAPVHATSITGLVNTGAGFPLGSNGVDNHWQLNGGPAYVSGTNGVFPVQTHWMADNATSRWITPTSNAGAPLDSSSTGTYVFTLNFSLAGRDPASASFSGRFAADDTVSSILLNGNPLSASGGQFSDWTGFAASSGFVSGLNTLSFTLTNMMTQGGTPAGLRVEFLGSSADTITAVPEPTTWAMLLCGFMATGMIARRRRKSGQPVAQSS